MSKTTTTTRQHIADVIRDTTAKLTNAKRPTATITVETLAETLLTIADAIDPPFADETSDTDGPICDGCGRGRIVAYDDPEVAITKRDGYFACTFCGSVYHSDDIDAIAPPA